LLLIIPIEIMIYMEINNGNEPVIHVKTTVQSIQHSPNNHRGNFPIILSLLLLLFIVGGGSYYLGTQNNKMNFVTQLTSPQPTTMPHKSISPSSTSTPTTTVKSNIYKNPKYSLQFNYPDSWNVIYDKQPDPTGNPSKYSITLENATNAPLNVTISNSEQFQTFDSLFEIGSLPGGTARITSEKEISIDGQRALYVIQNNSVEGFIVLDPYKNIVIFEVNSKNKEVLNEIMPTIKFKRLLN
jgi:hypothetical protein